MTDLQGKCAIVTGAATGVGEAIARRLAAGGADLVLFGHNVDGLQELARDLDPERARTICVEGDVTDFDQVCEAVERAESEYGALHLAVNSAGVTGPAQTPITDLSLEDWNAVLATDLTGMFLCLKAELPALARAGGGAIVNLSSANGVVGLPGLSAYTAAKHGVIGLTRAAALENADRNIRVNCIAPGYVRTERIAEMGDDLLAGFASVHPLNRLAEPEEVADFAAFLLSDRAGFCTGGVYPIDGGFTAR